jgi:hypothetical protein
MPKLRRARSSAWQVIWFGVGMFIVCGGLFGAFCWWAAIAPDPPKWVIVFRPLMRLSLMFLMVGTLLGPTVIYRGFKMLGVIAKEEQRLGAANLAAKKKTRKSQTGI